MGHPWIKGIFSHETQIQCQVRQPIEKYKAKYTKYSAQESGVDRTYKTQSSPEFAYASHFFNDFFSTSPCRRGSMHDDTSGGLLKFDKVSELESSQ